MSKEKQIEEMAADIRLNMQIQPNPKEHPSHQLARLMYNDGYRKQIEGDWIVSKTEQAWNNGEYPIERACSVCGLRRNIETQVAWNFCPNCGAKMKGGAE